MKVLSIQARTLGWAFFLSSLIIFSRVAYSKQADLSLIFTYQLSGNDLNTEMIWSLDPGQKNPHLQRWILSRKAKLIGLKAHKNKDGSYGVSATEISAVGEGYIRGPGSWYRPWSEFQCDFKPNSWFSQSEGAERAVSVAAQLWSDELKQKKIQLYVLLNSVRTQTQTGALDRADQLFRDWLRLLDEDWMKKANRLPREEEWKYYLSTAQSSKLCTGNHTASASSQLPVKSPLPPSVTSRMEKVEEGEAPSISKLLARVPVRLWDGLFSVRLNVTFAGKVLNGRFLIDSNARTSLISPAWLDSQGIYPAWIFIPHAPLEEVTWSGLLKSERPLARRVLAENVEMSGLNLALNEFLLTETDFYSPPDSVGTCCDGVLGMDFLRIYPLEFQSAAPSELRVWPRKGFHLNKENPWIEVSESERGFPVSSCSLVKNSSHLDGVNWDLANDEGLLVQNSWRALFKKEFSSSKGLEKSATLLCGSLDLGHGLIASLSGDSDSSTPEFPAMSIGMQVLSHGNFTFDLPHGRLWFAKSSLPLHSSLNNQSGLKLIYKMIGGERVLEVGSIDKKSHAKDLLQLGLKPGMIVAQVDSKPAEDMDLWEVERRLSGEYGNTVTLQWVTKKGLKMAPLKIRD